LFSRGGEKIFEHLSLRGILRGVFDPVKVEADFADGRTSFDKGFELLDPASVQRRPSWMDAECGQNELASFGDFQSFQIRRRIHGRGEGKNSLFLDLLQGGSEGISVFINMRMGID
jgi:hypothetical protein